MGVKIAIDITCLTGLTSPHPQTGGQVTHTHNVLAATLLALPCSLLSIIREMMSYFFVSSGPRLRVLQPTYMVNRPILPVNSNMIGKDFDGGVRGFFTKEGVHDQSAGKETETGNCMHCILKVLERMVVLLLPRIQNK